MELWVLFTAAVIAVTILVRHFFFNQVEQEVKEEPIEEELIENKDDPYTLEELSKFDGKDGRPIYMAVSGTVFNVSSKPEMYGPEGAYGLFSGKEATRGLAKSSLKVEDLQPFGSKEGLTAGQLRTLADWEEYYKERYQIMGHVVESK
ncbi:steroid-binding protein [Acrasis kona]|uniref:Steroid-binding protein n=1 Tax=Acrasis kona TaxID=1008807 RepID=A0AAW2ZJV0_9EUKA